MCRSVDRTTGPNTWDKRRCSNFERGGKETGSKSIFFPPPFNEFLWVSFVKKTSFEIQDLFAAAHVNIIRWYTKPKRLYFAWQQEQGTGSGISPKAFQMLLLPLLRDRVNPARQEFSITLISPSIKKDLGFASVTQYKLSTYRSKIRNESIVEIPRRCLDCKKQT